VVDLSSRSTDPEQLDLGVAEEEAVRSLRDLRFVNRWLGGRRSLVRALSPWLRQAGRLSLLDVGCGAADVPAWLAGTARGRLLAVGLDLKLAHLRQVPADVAGVLADVRALPFRPGAFDLVTANLFLHHFDGSQVSELLRCLHALARRALVVSDLRRARVPYLFGRLCFPLIFRSRVSVADGLLSIRRGFTETELAAAFREAGIHQVQIERCFPYRLLAVAARP